MTLYFLDDDLMLLPVGDIVKKSISINYKKKYLFLVL